MAPTVKEKGIMLALIPEVWLRAACKLGLDGKLRKARKGTAIHGAWRL